MTISEVSARGLDTLAAMAAASVSRMILVGQLLGRVKEEDNGMVECLEAASSDLV